MKQDPQAIETLREMLPVGSLVYTVLASVSSSGMSRHIRCVVGTRNGGVRDITDLVAQAAGFRMSNKTYALVVGGVGMDMGFHVVYSLARALYPDGHKCTGSDGWKEHPSDSNNWDGVRSKVPVCPSNDHSNDYGELSRKFKDVWQANHGGAEVPERYNGATQADIESYVAERSKWISAQPLYTKRRKHSDGGYALKQSWL